MLVRAINQFIWNTANLRRSGLASLFLFFMLSGSTSGAGSALPAPADGEGGYDMARLRSGEILLQTLYSDEPGAAARVTALFHSSADVVWDVIGYCKYERIYIRGLRLCEVLNPGLSRMVMHHRIRNSWYTPMLDFTFEASRKPDDSGEARLVGGNLKVLQGQWRLLPLADGNELIVIHEIRIQPRTPAPRWLVRRSLRRDLPDMLACIRGLAKASGDRRLIAVDLERCPGDVSSLASPP